MERLSSSHTFSKTLPQMPSNPASQSKLRIAFRWLAISLAAIAATWLVVIFWWQTTQRAVTSTDALLHLVALPLVVLLCTGLLRRRLSAKTKAALPQSGQSVPADAPSTTPNAEKDAAMRTLKLPVVAAWAATSLASNGEAFLEILAEQRSRPTPDEFLTNDHGFPILTGRVKELDTSAVIHNLVQTGAGHALENTAYADEARDALLRALALLESVLEQAACDWPLNNVDIDSSRMSEDNILTLRGAPSLAATAAGGLTLRVKLLVSEDLEPGERQAAQAYVAKRLSAYGISAQQMAADVVATGDDATALLLADEFCIDALNAPGNDSPQALLILAAASTLCPSIVDSWESRENLFDPRRPNGLMMGEAAFGVLCANEKALQAAAASPICYLTRVIRSQRDASTSGKTAHECLAATIGAALNATDLSADAIGTAVCDADHRTNRTLESIEAMLNQTPKLDAIQNRLAINEACGHLAAASVLGVLATGAIQSGSAGHPVLLFNVSHAAERAAAVLIPADGNDRAAHPQHLQAA